MTRILAGCSLAILLAVCSIVAAQRGLAALYANPGESSITAWREEPRKARWPDWKAARVSLERAVSYDAHNPAYPALLGHAYDGEVAYYPVADQAAAGQREKARELYLQALSGRPTWPHDWMALALVKYRLGQIDAEFHHALRTAVALGPWEPSVQFQVIEIGLHHWVRFDDDTRRFIHGVLRDGMQVMPMDMARLAQRYGMLDLACEIGSREEQVIKYCERN